MVQVVQLKAEGVGGLGAWSFAAKERQMLERLFPLRVLQILGIAAAILLAAVQLIRH